MYPVLDASENMYYAGRVALGGGTEPTGWTAVNGSPWTAGSIEKIDKDFTILSYSTWSEGGQGASSFAYLGTNSGINLAYGRLIACGENGNNVTSHSLAAPAITQSLSLSNGQTAKLGTNYAVTAPINEPTLTVTRSVPTMSIGTASASYVSEAWTFTDPGSDLAWDLFVL